MSRPQPKPPAFGPRLSKVIDEAALFDEHDRLQGVMRQGEWLSADKFVVARSHAPGAPPQRIRRRRLKARLAADGSVALVGRNGKLELVWTLQGDFAGAMDRGMFIDKDEISMVSEAPKNPEQ